jgi:hypothetical protein
VRIDCLNSLQAKAARIIAGAYRSTSGPALDVELYLLPMAQQIWKKNAETVSGILSTHNITGLVEFRFFRTKRCRWRQKPYLSPLEHIFRRLYQRRGPTIQRQEIVLPYLAPPWWRGPITSIAGDSQTAIGEHNRELRNFPNNLHIYTDGSGISGHVGAAAVSPTTGHIRKAYMGTSDTTTVHAGELQGIKLALLIASDDQEAGRKRDKIVIYTYNQAAIRISGHPIGRSGAYIIADIVHLIDKL